ncbi:hypothetical protein CT19431_30098 [Cupriavidus taiwanensis]|nr:hypothetical protein CT19431_30098 [Cupriavidus taiwanensis]
MSRLFPCLSEATSDFVNRAETDEVPRFIRGEGVGGNAEDLADFITVPPFQFTNRPAGRNQSTRAARVHQCDHANHLGAAALDVVGQFRKGASHCRNVVYQHIVPAGFYIAGEFSTRVHPFHRIRACVKDPGYLHDRLVDHPAEFTVQIHGQHMWNGIVTRCLSCVRCHKDARTGKTSDSQLSEQRRRKICHQPNRGLAVARLRSLIARMSL